MSPQTASARLLRPALTGAALASCLIATMFGLAAFVAGVVSVGSHPVAGLVLSPFVGAGLAVICGLLGLAPALAWIAGAVFAAPRLLASVAERWRGPMLGLAGCAPAWLVGHWIGQMRLPGAGGAIGPAMDGAVIAGALVAGVI